MGFQALAARRFPFVPTDIPGCAVWYLADDAGVNADGIQIGDWPDRSGGGRNAVQGTSTQRPLWTRNVLNGKPAARFDGANDTMPFDGSFLIGQPYTVYLVVRVPTPTAALYFLGGTGTANNSNLIMGWRTTTQFTMDQKNNALDSSATTPSATGAIWSGVRGTAGRALYQNALSRGSDANATLIATMPDLALEFLPGVWTWDLMELLIYLGAHDDTARFAVESYLAEKYFIRLEEAVAAAASGLLTGLVAYWKLDEASGTRSDSVGTSHLADNNTVTSAAGKVGTAAQFVAGNNEYLSVADNADLSMGDIDFTIAAWVLFPAGVSNSPVFCGKFNGGSNQREYALWFYSSSGKFSFIISADGTTNPLVESDSPTVALDTWFLLIGWHDATANTINIQVNDSTVYSLSHTGGIFNGTADFLVGAIGGSSGQNHNGLVDEIGIWKRTLTSTERTNLWNSGNGITHPFTGVP